MRKAKKFYYRFLSARQLLRGNLCGATFAGQPLRGNLCGATFA
jgi:hypothetical protein